MKTDWEEDKVSKRRPEYKKQGRRSDKGYGEFALAFMESGGNKSPDFIEKVRRKKNKRGVRAHLKVGQKVLKKTRKIEVLPFGWQYRKERLT